MSWSWHSILSPVSPMQSKQRTHWTRRGHRSSRPWWGMAAPWKCRSRSEEHTSELQSHSDLFSFPTRRSSDLVRFLESIDVSVVPFVTVEVRRAGNELVLAFDSVPGVTYAVQAKDTLDAPWSSILKTVVGNGGPLEVSVQIGRAHV